MYAIISFLWLLIVDTTFSWARMFTALGISIFISLAIGIFAARSKIAESIILPVVDVFQTIPILAFFPIAVYVIVGIMPGYIGINAAVILLIITSMVWNIIFGVYESVKSLPKNYIEMSSIYRMGRFSRIKNIYMPAAMERVVGQSILSWSIGLFYLVTSEIFSTGNQIYTVKNGIGVELLKLGLTGNALYYMLGITVFVLFVVATRFLFFMPLERIFSVKGKKKKTVRKNQFSFITKPLSTVLKDMYKYTITPSENVYKRSKPIWHKTSIERTSGAQKRYILCGITTILVAFAIYILVSDPSIASYEYIAIKSLAFSFVRVWAAFALITLVSIFVSVYLVFKSNMNSVYLFILQILASIPATILLPIIVRYSSNLPYSSEIVAFLIFFLSGIWYFIFSTVSTGRTIPKYISEVVRIFNIKGRTAMTKVYLKALMPGIVTGGITAVAAEWNASIVAERFTTSAISNGTVLTSVHTGIGKLLDVALEQGNITLMIIALINLVIIIIIINKLVWHRLYNRTTEAYR